MQDAQKRKEIIQMGLIFGLLLLITVFIPGSEILALFVLPIPFVFYASRYGYRSTLQLGVIVLILSLVITVFVFTGAFPLTLIAVSGGILIGHAIHQERHPYETWALGTIGVTVGLVVSFVMLQLLTEVDLLDTYKSIVNESMATTETVINATGLQLSDADLKVIEEQMLQIIVLLPSLLVLMAIGISFMTQWLSYKVLSWRNNKQLAFPAFRTFLLPKVVLWIYFIAILFSWFQIDATGGLADAVLNTTNLISSLLSLQGISFILFYFHQKRLSIAFPILIIISSIIFLPIGIYLTRILGIIDVGFDLRERMKQTK